MDAFSDPTVERITVMASTQVGKTESILNMIGYAIDQDPGSLLLVMPREEDAISIGQRRIRPMIEASPQLERHLSESKADNKQKEIRFSRSMLYFAGSNSPADLASRAIKYLACDEVDKFPMFSGREADPISLAEQRTRTYFNRKIVLTSTPTTRNGYIFRQYELSDQQQYWVPCPHCEEMQTLEFSQVKWPEDVRDPDILKMDKLAHYECVHCEKAIVDLDKMKMLNEGEWRSSNPEKVASIHRGFRIHALYSPWLTFSEVASKFLESKDDPASLMNFVNSYLGWIWEEKSEKVEADDLEYRSKEYKRGTVPEGAIVLTAGVDVQQDHLFYVVRAWGAQEESWLVECGRLDAGLESLVGVLINRVFEGNNTKHKIRLVCIDSGYRTNEVYQFSRRYAEIVRPIKGQQKISGVPIRATKIDRDASGDTIRHSVRLFNLDVSHFKDKVTRLMTAQDGEPGAWHLHSEVPGEYLRHVTSEHKVLTRNRRTGATKAEWTVKPGGGANHWWDCEIYATAAADMLAVYTITELPEEVPPPKATPNKFIDDESVRWTPSKKKGSWLNG